ncbi:MAG: hypothetical protein AAGA93_21880 [Actinomycetota bacterium]
MEHLHGERAASGVGRREWLGVVAALAIGLALVALKLYADVGAS